MLRLSSQAEAAEARLASARLKAAQQLIVPGDREALAGEFLGSPRQLGTPLELFGPRGSGNPNRHESYGPALAWAGVFTSAADQADK